MSGGHFEYGDSSLFSFINQIEDDLQNEEYEEFFENKEVKNLVSLIINETRKTGELLHAYDLMISGDTCEDFFVKKIKKILSEN